MTYTCNKKSYPRFHDDCLKCPEYDPCAKGGKRCFIGAMENEKTVPDCCTPLAQNAAAPVLRPHDYRNIKIDESTTVTIDLEEIKENLHKSFMPNLLQYGG